jgi:hypothetical protein
MSNRELNQLVRCTLLDALGRIKDWAEYDFLRAAKFLTADVFPYQWCHAWRSHTCPKRNAEEMVEAQLVLDNLQWLVQHGKLEARTVSDDRDLLIPTDTVLYFLKA